MSTNTVAAGNQGRNWGALGSLWDSLRNPPSRRGNRPRSLQRNRHRNVRRAPHPRARLHTLDESFPLLLCRRHTHHHPLRTLRHPRGTGPPRRKVLSTLPVNRRRPALRVRPPPRHNPRNLHPGPFPPLTRQPPATPSRPPSRERHIFSIPPHPWERHLPFIPRLSRDESPDWPAFPSILVSVRKQTGEIPGR